MNISKTNDYSDGNCYVFAVRDLLLQYFNHDFAKMQDKLHQVMDNEKN